MDKINSSSHKDSENCASFVIHVFTILKLIFTHYITPFFRAKKNADQDVEDQNQSVESDQSPLKKLDLARPRFLLGQIKLENYVLKQDIQLEQHPCHVCQTVLVKNTEYFTVYNICC